MTTIPKPKYCGQQWLDMTPTNGGRICGKCSKLIVDFSKKTWSEIESIQLENKNSICGMYSRQQISEWGHVPTDRNSSFKILAVSLLLTVQLHGQDDIKIFKGVVTTKSTQNYVDTLPFASVWLKGTKIGTTTDAHGKFQLEIPATYLDTANSPAILFHYIGYSTLELKLAGEIKPDEEFNAQLIADQSTTTIFYVNEPTRLERIKFKFKRFFGRKDK